MAVCLGGVCLPRGDVCPGGCPPGEVSARGCLPMGVGGVHPPDPEADTPCGQNDSRLCKHYLSATTVADGKYLIQLSKHFVFSGQRLNQHQRSGGRRVYLISQKGGCDLWTHNRPNQSLLRRQVWPVHHTWICLGRWLSRPLLYLRAHKGRILDHVSHRYIYVNYFTCVIWRMLLLNSSAIIVLYFLLLGPLTNSEHKTLLAIIAKYGFLKR